MKIKREIGTHFSKYLNLKIAFLKAFFNLNENSFYKGNREHREPLAKAARALKGKYQSKPITFQGSYDSENEGQRRYLTCFVYF